MIVKQFNKEMKYIDCEFLLFDCEGEMVNIASGITDVLNAKILSVHRVLDRKNKSYYMLFIDM